MIPNMFEFSIALKYLLPNRKQKSVSFVAFIASLVIAVILWLLIVFVSITQSIETQWLSKITALSAPIRIKPKDYYFNSYYHLVDQVAEASNFQLKNFKEKKESLLSDPYNPEVDENIAHLPLPNRDRSGNFIDPVKRLDLLLKQYQTKKKIQFDLFELSAGAIHINFKKNGSSQTLNQILYVSSFSPYSLQNGKLIETFDAQDLEALFKRKDLSDSLLSLKQTEELFDITEIEIQPFKVPLQNTLLKKQTRFDALAEFNAEGALKRVMIYDKDKPINLLGSQLTKGVFDTELKTFNGHKIENQKVFLGSVKNLKLAGIKDTPEDRLFLFQSSFLDKNQFFELSSHDFKIEKVHAKKNARSIVQSLLLKQKSSSLSPILVPNNFKEQGAKVGDKGYIAYGAKTVSGFQEMKYPIVIAGFYDPGIFSLGAKVAIVPSYLTEELGKSATTYALDPKETSGYFVFFERYKDAIEIKNDLNKLLIDNEIDHFFEVQTYQEYPFVKEILDQFASDKLLFYVVGFIIMVVALSNIAFLMQLLARDKSQEMAIIRSLGADFKNIQNIFISCGLFLGLISATLATTLAYFTIKFINPIMKALGQLLGHDIAKSLFYGSCQESHMDPTTVIALFAITPLFCALSAYLATNSFKKKSISEFLKDSK
jgi:lipoprotein-releasing system permease protein